MKTISTTEARKNIASMIDAVKETDAVFLIGRRDVPDAVLLKFPSEYKHLFSDITNINAYSSSFAFLKEEPDLYSVADLKKKYV